jgi:hypothetical protein
MAAQSEGGSTPRKLSEQTMRALYAPLFRPPTQYGSVPKGWTLVERGKQFDCAPLRTDLPRGDHPFGVIAYDVPLLPAEEESFELRRLNSGDPSSWCAAINRRNDELGIYDRMDREEGLK